MRPAIGRESRQPQAGGDGHRGQGEHAEGTDERVDRQQLHLRRLDALAHVFGCAPDHQAGEKQAQQGHHQDTVDARPQAAKDHFPQEHVRQRHRPTQRGIAIVRRVGGAGGSVGGRHRRENRAARAKAHLFPLHIRLRRPDEGGKLGVAALLRPGSQSQRNHEQEDHHPQQQPPLAGPAEHAPEGVGQGGRNDGDAEHLDQIGKPGRVLVGVRAVDVEEPPAVGSQVLDALQGGHRPLRDGLDSPSERMHSGIRAEVHRHPLPDQHQADQHRGWQQHPQQPAHQVHPEVAQRLGVLAREPAHEGDADGEPTGPRQEILDDEADELARVTHGRLAGVGLPGGGRGETDGGVHR